MPGLAGGFMSEIKYQFLSEPIYASIDGGIGCLVTNDATYFDGYPMIIIGSNRFYGGYRGIFRTGNYSEENTSFQSYTHGVFIGNKVGPGPYLRPEIHVYSGDFKDFFYVFGLGLQF